LAVTRCAAVVLAGRQEEVHDMPAGGMGGFPGGAPGGNVEEMD